MRSVFIERTGAGVPETLDPTALVRLARPRGQAVVSARDGLSTRPDGPFRPLARALVEDHAIREAFAEALAPPSWARARRQRWVSPLVVLPWLMWMELDREILVGVRGDVGPRVFMDALTLFVIVREMFRPVAARPRTIAILSFAGAARCVYFASESCGRGVHPAMWAAAALGTAMGLFFLAAPAPERVALELVDRLGLEAEEARAARKPPPVATGHVAAAVGVALALPILLWLTRAWGALAQGVVFFAFAAIAPEVVRRSFEGRLPDLGSGELSRILERGLRAGIVGAVLAAGLVNGAHWLSGTAGHLERCRDPGGYPASVTRRALARELSEVRGGRGGTGTGHGVVLAVLLIPLAEERVYRGFVQRLLARRWGTEPGIAGGALLFGAAHLGVYQVAVYQTVLLGIASGVAFSEGGLLAGFVAHALWNAHALL